MNSLDPSLAKYLSSSKQDIYDEYHGTGTAGTKKKSKKRKVESGSAGGAGLVIAGDDGSSWNPWTATERKAYNGGNLLNDEDEENDRLPGEASIKLSMKP